METQAVFTLGNSGHSSSFFVLFPFLISTFLPPYCRDFSLYFKGKESRRKSWRQKKRKDNWPSKVLAELGENWLCLEKEWRPAFLRHRRNGSEGGEGQHTTNFLYFGQEVEKIGADSCDGLWSRRQLLLLGQRWWCIFSLSFSTLCHINQLNFFPFWKTTL